MRSQSPAAHCRSVLAQTTPCTDCASVSGSMSWNKPWSEAALELFDERLEHRGVCGLDQLGEANICDCASRDRRRRSDLMFSSNARSSRAVDPCGDRLNGIGGVRHFPSAAAASQHEPSPERRPLPAGPLNRNVDRTPVCSGRARSRTTETLRPRTPCSRTRFRCRSQDRAAHIGVGCELVAPARSSVGSCARVVGAEVLREPFADGLGRQAVVGQVVVVCTAGARLVVARPTARPSER